MSDLLVVSRTPSLAMGLAGTRHHARVVSPAEAAAGTPDARARADVVVVDLDTPADAVTALAALRARAAAQGGGTTPAIVVSGEGVEWSDALAGLPSVAMLARPVTQSAVLAAVDRVLGAPRHAAPSSDGPRRPGLPVVPPPVMTDPSDTGTAAGDDGEADRLVEALLPRADALLGVPEVASSVVETALELTASDAAALLVPDGPRWRVAAGAGLRPLEHHVQLDPRVWLVRTVATSAYGLVVEDTDIARQQLAGAPLASRRHLMAAPVPGQRSVLLVARESDPYTSTDLAALARLGAEAAEPLDRAVAVRALARALAPLADEAPAIDLRAGGSAASVLPETAAARGAAPARETARTLVVDLG